MDARILLTSMGELAVERCRTLGIPVLAPAVDATRIDRVGFVIRHLRQLRDVLHLHAPPPWLAPFLGLLPSPVRVLHLHTAPPSRVIDRLAARILIGRSHANIAVSHWVANEWRAVFPKHAPIFEVVHNAVHLPDELQDHHSPQRDHAPVFGIASRLATNKKIDVFLQIAAVISRLQPNAEFRIAGSGPEMAKLQRIASELGIERSVSFDGFIRDVASFWRGIDVSIFTADKEPFGLCLLEPLAAGAGVVAFRTGAGSDEVLDRCSGIISISAGDVEAAAHAALTLALDRRRLDALVERGRADARQWFSFTRMEAAIQECYDRALGMNSSH